MKNRYVFIFLAGILTFGSLEGSLIIDASNKEFYSHVKTELKKMRLGDRGIVLQTLIRRLDSAAVDTQIKPLTRNEETWHPNDRKGLKSHVLPIDTQVRGSARKKPTPAIVYLHPSRINPRLSTFKLGTFAHALGEALDLNEGTYHSDYRIREKRASFFRNAWRDALGYPVLMNSGQVSTEEYADAKEQDLITIENAVFFPLVGGQIRRPIPTKSYLSISNLRRFSIQPGESRAGQIYYGEYEWGAAFLKVVDADEEVIQMRFGSQMEGQYEIYEARLSRDEPKKVFRINKDGIDFSKLISQSKLVDSGLVDESIVWEKEIPHEKEAVDIRALRP